MKPIEFLGDALRTIRAFPEDARRMAGAELCRVQLGEEPKDWKPFPTIGPGVCEIRVRESGGAFRVIYLAALSDAVYVLHAFQKKAMKTPRARDRPGKGPIGRSAEARQTMSRRQVFADVWDAIEDDPAERARLRMRSELLSGLERCVIGWNVTQSEAAKRLGITQPRLNDLLRGRFNKFSLGALFDLATRAGIAVRLTIDGKAPATRPRKAVPRKAA